MLFFEEDGIVNDRCRSDALLYLIVVRANAGIMQKVEQFLSVVEPEDLSLAVRASELRLKKRNFDPHF